MASPKESSADQANQAALDDEDIRGDGKKKKFKPLSAVRRFFSKKRKKEDSVVTVKAQSTTALHSRRTEDDDDGGFKSRSRAKPSLAANRSISEDSVFHQEARETSINRFPTTALSVESIPKVSFQNELLDKLGQRRPQYSDDDQDDGLPRSSTPPVTTVEIVVEPIRSADKKSSIRDSDQSLTSLDPSDEDDLFQVKRKGGVPSLKAGNTSSVPSGMDVGNLNFSDIERTEVLKSTMAKDRISVKPKARKASRLSRRAKETPSPSGLPSLNEESPSRSQTDAPIPGTKADKASTPTTSAESKTVEIKATTSPTASKSPEANKPSAAKALGASKESVKEVPCPPAEEKNKSVEDLTKSTDTKASSITTTSATTASPTKTGGSDGLKVTDPSSNITVSPKEDYRLKRQNRSRTLPSGISEDSSPKVQRANSHRAPVVAVSTPPASTETQKVSSPEKSNSVRKLDTSRFTGLSNSSNSEPAWVSKMKKKKMEQASGSVEDSKATEAESSAQQAKGNDTSPAPAPQPIDASDKKGAGIDATKNKENNSQSEASKKPDSTSSTKRASIDIGSVRKQSIEINVNELSSVKVRSSAFSSPNKPDTAASKTAYKDSVKPLVPSSSSSSSSSSPSSTPATTQSTTSLADRAKMFSSSPSSDNSSTKTTPSISQGRAGSVKNSPTKSAEVKSVFSARGGSVKAPVNSGRVGTTSSAPSWIKSDTPLSKTDAENTSVSESPAVTSSGPAKPSTLSSSSRPPLHSSKAGSPSSSSTPTPTTQASSKASSPSSPSQTASSFIKPAFSTSSIKSSPSSTSKPFSPNAASASSSSTTQKPLSSSTANLSQTKSVGFRPHGTFVHSSPPSSSSNSSSPATQSPSSSALSKPSPTKTSSAGVQKSDEKSSPTNSNIPAWRANLQKKNVKIEIIENTSSQPSPKSSENEKKSGDSCKVAEISKVFQYQR